MSALPIFEKLLGEYLGHRVSVRLVVEISPLLDGEEVLGLKRYERHIEARKDTTEKDEEQAQQTN
tara:strand:- start:125 stop:319 length:195 start_codon:yes stop_codon:yes gene_type:complete